MAFLAGSAAADPGASSAETPADAVLQLLQDRGLLAIETAPAAEGMLDQMRSGASDLVISAMNFLGVPYRRGGNTASEGFDCSGFTRHIFESSLGLVLPRRADEQATKAGLLHVSRSELKPGDLVFFDTMRRAFSHVGIYVGDGKFIHSPKPGAEVRIEDMRKAYWHQRYNGARRAGALQPAAADPGIAAALPTR